MTSVNSVFLLLGAVILTGYLLKARGVFKENDYKLFFKLIVTLVIPCLILTNFKTVVLTPEYLSIFALSCAFGLLLSAVVYLLLPGKTRRQKGMAVLKNGQFAGYLVGNITELVLENEADCEGVLKAWHIAHGKEHVGVSAPVWNKQRARTLSKVAGSCRSGMIEMFRLNDFEKNIRLWLNLKASYARLTDGRFVLESEGERIAIEVKDNAVSVQKTDEAPDAVLSRLEAQDLLISNMRWVDTDNMPACVENWFPLPLSACSADGY